MQITVPEYDLCFTDPPWTQRVLNHWLTQQGLPSEDLTVFLYEYAHVLQIANPNYLCFFEICARKADMMTAAVSSRLIAREDSCWYGNHTSYTTLVFGGSHTPKVILPKHTETRELVKWALTTYGKPGQRFLTLNDWSGSFAASAKRQKMIILQPEWR